MNKKVKNTVSWTYILNNLNGKRKYWNILRKRITKNK